MTITLPDGNDRAISVVAARRAIRASCATLILLVTPFVLFPISGKKDPHRNMKLRGTSDHQACLSSFHSQVPRRRRMLHPSGTHARWSDDRGYPFRFGSPGLQQFNTEVCFERLSDLQTARDRHRHHQLVRCSTLGSSDEERHKVEQQLKEENGVNKEFAGNEEPSVGSRQIFSENSTRCSQSSATAEHRSPRHRALSLSPPSASRGGLRLFNSRVGRCGNSEAVDSLLGQMPHLNLRPSIVTYTKIISAYTKLGQWRRALHYWWKVRHEAIPFTTGRKEVGTSGDSESLLGKEKAWMSERPASLEANTTPKLKREKQKYWGRFPGGSLRIDVQACNAAMKAYATGAGWFAAFSLARDMREASIRPNVYVYTTLATIAERAGRWSLALQLCKEAESENIHQTVQMFAAAQQARVSGKLWRQALDVDTELKRNSMQQHGDSVHEKECTTSNSKIHSRKRPPPLRPNTVTTGIYLSACAVGAQWQRALSEFEQLAKLTEHNSNKSSNYSNEAGRSSSPSWSSSPSLSPSSSKPLFFNSHIASKVIEAMGRGKQPDKAIEVFRRLEDGKLLRPNLFVVNSAIQALGSNHHWESALSLYSDTQKPSSQIRVDAVTISTLLHSLAEVAKSRERRQRLNTGPDGEGGEASEISSREDGRKGAGRRHAWEIGLEIYRTALDSGVTMNERCLGAAIRMQEIAKSWTRAVEILQESQRSGYRPGVHAHTAAISACSEAAEWREALNIIQRMLKHSIAPSIRTITAAVSACQRAKNWQRALGLLTIPKAMHLRWDSQMYDTVIATYASSKKWETALRLFESLPEKKLEPKIVTYNAALYACKRGFKWEAALVILQKAYDNNLTINAATRRQMEGIYQQMEIPGNNATNSSSSSSSSSSNSSSSYSSSRMLSL